MTQVETIHSMGHPRAGGEVVVGQTSGNIYAGSSPRRQGASERQARPRADSRVIPERSGNSWWCHLAP